MFLSRHLVLREIVRANSDAVFRKSTMFRNYSLSTFPETVHVIAWRKYIPERSFTKLISRKYSNEVNEYKEEMIYGMNDVNERSPDTTETMFESIANGDPQILRKLKLLKFEIEVYQQTGERVPDTLKKAHWEALLTLDSLPRRKKYLNYLFKNEKSTINRKAKKLLLREQYLKTKNDSSVCGPLSYNLSNQCLLLRIYKKTLNHLLYFRNEMNKPIAQHIIFDCSYQEYMGSLNTKFCALQLQYCLHLNLYHRYPNYVSLFNIKKSDALYETLPLHMKNIYRNDFAWPIYEESYLDFYPKENLVYLTPHCNEPLMNLNPEDVYIIGAFVDRGNGVKASLARAKKYKLRMARLPLNEHIKWKQGTKSLPLNIVMKILLDMKFYNNWNEALKNIPKRNCAYSDLNVKNSLNDDILV